MDKSISDNMALETFDDMDSSGYLNSEESDAQLDFGGLFSSKFTNIVPINSSNSGPAEIYTATRYGKRFVLKGLKEQYRNDPIYTLAMAKEFEIGLMLEHPNIRRTLSLETVEGLGKVIVLEYVDGCSLDELLEKGCMTVSSARHIAEQIAGALGYIHSKQIYHRDLKPSNILVMHHDNVVKLIDFSLSDSDQFIILKNPAGSKKYMAPELQNPAAKPTAVADIYSMGVVTGELASSVGDDLLAQAAEKCMNPNPDKRPQSMSQIKLPASSPSVMETVYNFLSSKTLTYVLGGICLLLVALIYYLQHNF